MLEWTLEIEWHLIYENYKQHVILFYMVILKKKHVKIGITIYFMWILQMVLHMFYALVIEPISKQEFRLIDISVRWEERDQ